MDDTLIFIVGCIATLLCGVATMILISAIDTDERH